MKKNTFKKEERLCNKRSIDDLFHKGSSFVCYPFRIVFMKPGDWQEVGEHPVSVLVSVPKRRIRKAADRNLVKRRIREAYRLQKKELLEDFFVLRNLPVNFVIQYLPSEILDYASLYEKMTGALHRLRTEYAKIYLGESH